MNMFHPLKYNIEILKISNLLNKSLPPINTARQPLFYGKTIPNGGCLNFTQLRKEH